MFQSVRPVLPYAACFAHISDIYYMQYIFRLSTCIIMALTN